MHMQKQNIFSAFVSFVNKAEASKVKCLILWSFSQASRNLSHIFLLKPIKT